MSDTETTTGLETALRSRLLTFEPLAGSPLATVLGITESGAGSDGKLFWDAAPDNIGPRWGILRLQNRRSSGDGWEQEVAELEITLFARPRSQKVTLELCADLCDQAMLRFRYTDATSVVGCWGRLRSTLPPFTGPADTEVVQIRLVYSLVFWLTYLTQYHDS